MKILSLFVEKDELEELASGKITNQEVDVTPINERQLLQVDKDGFQIEDEDGNSLPIQYDSIRFMTYVERDLHCVDIPVVGTKAVAMVDEDGNPMVYLDGKDEYEEMYVSYDLGKPGVKRVAKLEKDTLNLIIKQKYFDAILEGRKVQEFREVRPTTYKKLLLTDEDGNIVFDKNCNCYPIRYKYIQFYVGYNKDRDSAKVEIESGYNEYMTKEKRMPNGMTEDVFMSYMYEGQKWYTAEITYNLGEIIEHTSHKS